MRPIDADELKRDFRQTFVDGESIDVCEVIERIDLLAPTITLTPLAHAEWKHRDNSRTCRRIGDYEEWYECSGCEGSSEQMSNFCPNCGAQMDKTNE